MTEKILLWDRDICNVIGLLIVKDHTKEEVERLFNTVKTELADSWTLEDLFESMNDKQWEYTLECIKEIEL